MITFNPTLVLFICFSVSLLKTEGLAKAFLTLPLSPWGHQGKGSFPVGTDPFL